MNIFNQKIEEIILKNNNIISEKIIGINYLEQLKYLIINDLKNLNKSDFDLLLVNIKFDQTKKFELKEFFLESSIYLYKNSLSKIKSSYNHDILSIMINGYKTVTIFDRNINKKSISLHITKNMGLVLGENTVTSEKIAAGSVILDVMLKKN